MKIHSTWSLCQMGKEELNIQFLKAVNNFDLDKIESLVRQGADVNVRDWDGDTALHNAVMVCRVDCIKLLIKLGADMELKDDIKPNDYKDPWKEGYTPLFLALVNSSLKSLKCLIEHGADINTKNNKGITPLYYLVKCFNGVEDVRYFVENGADVTDKNGKDQTALDLARENGKHEVASFLESFMTHKRLSDVIQESPFSSKGLDF